MKVGARNYSIHTPNCVSCITRGVITYQTYDPVTGALIQRIDDVDTALMSDVPEGWTTVPGWGLHLITDYVNDSQGRILQALGPWHEVQLQEKDTTPTSIRRVQFTAYVDAAHEVRQASGYLTGGGDLAAYTVVGAVSITRNNANGQTIDVIQAVRACNCGALTASESFPQSAWSRWTHYIYDIWGRLSSQRVYFRIPPRGEGEAAANYLETVYGYDIMARQNRVIEPSGTIRRTVYDVRGLVVSSWVGTEDRDATDDDPSGGGAAGNNMVMVSENEYDEGEAGGPGNLTKVTNPVDSNSANDRVTFYAYDYRNRRNTMTTTDGVTTWIAKTAYDNQNRPIENTKYQSTVADANRIARSRTLYDLLGRVYRQETDGVDPNDGSITNTLSAQNWYDLGGNTIKKSPAGSTSFTKTVFDALSRPTITYTACVPGTAGVPAGDDNDVSGDTVLEQNGTIYDRGGNVIQTNRSQRFDDAIGTGALQDVNTQPKARVSSVAMWPDGLGRIRNTADYGTNGGAALERPPVVPLRSDTVLVSTNRFKDDGEANATIDPMGLETRWDNDQMGRRTRLIENYVHGCEDQSRISEYVYHASGQLQRLTLQNSQTGDQVTQWIFGTTLFDSTIADNNLLRAKIYPESDDRPAPPSDGPDGVYCRLEYAVNRQGQVVTFTDADDTVHAYSYDKLGRQIADAVTVLGPDLDDSVLRIERAYETRGMLATVTSYNAASAGAVVNQVVMVYDAFGNLAADKQSHGGAVSGGTPVVVYSYTDGGANTVRRTAITYPNGKALNYFYGSANSVDDHFNRVTALKFAGDSTPLVEYTYVGVAWQIRVGYPGPGVELTYKRQGDEPIGDAGDPYNGYDRFGRTQDIWWRTTE